MTMQPISDYMVTTSKNVCRCREVRMGPYIQLNKINTTIQQCQIGQYEMFTLVQMFKQNQSSIFFANFPLTQWES